MPFWAPAQHPASSAPRASITPLTLLKPSALCPQGRYLLHCSSSLSSPQSFTLSQTQNLGLHQPFWHLNCCSVQTAKGRRGIRGGPARAPVGHQLHICHRARRNIAGRSGWLPQRVCKRTTLYLFRCTRTSQQPGARHASINTHALELQSGISTALQTQLSGELKCFKLMVKLKLTLLQQDRQRQHCNERRCCNSGRALEMPRSPEWPLTTQGSERAARPAAHSLRKQPQTGDQEPEAGDALISKSLINFRPWTITFSTGLLCESKRKNCCTKKQHPCITRVFHMYSAAPAQFHNTTHPPSSDSLSQTLKSQED